MAIEDYVPNIFGGVPVGYEGLLGAEQSAALQKRSNLAGLLGFGAALAQGMSPGGYRRSALQNILGAAAQGFAGAGQTYEAGIKNAMTQQQFALQQRQMAGIQAMKLKYPDLADEFDTNPAGAFRLVAEREQARIKPITVGEGQTVISPQGEVLFSAPGAKKKSTAVVGNTIVDLETGQPIYTGQAESKPVVVGGNLVDPVTGQVIFSAPTEAKPVVVGGNLVDPTTGRVVFTAPKEEKPATSIEEYNFYRSQGGKKTYEQFLESKTPKTSVNISNEKFSAEFGKGVAGAVEATYNRAQSAQNTISTINTIKPIIQEGVYSGPLSSSTAAINRLASSFGISSGTTEEKLQRTSQAMQGLASLELQAAEAMKGQGAITDFERTLIARAAGGDLQKLTQKEVVGLLGALEKVAKKKIETHKTNLERLRKRPDTRELADFYELGQSKPQKFVFDPASGSLQPKGE